MSAEWREVDWIECERCGQCPVEVYTDAREGYVRDDDPARCPDCGATGSIWTDGAGGAAADLGGQDDDDDD